MANEAPPGFVTKADYARHREVSRAAVTQWANAGRLVLAEDGRVNLAASDAALAKALDPSRGGKGGKTRARSPAAAANAASPAPDSYTAVRTTRESFAAKNAELEYRERVGELVEKARYDKALRDAMAPILARLDSIGSRIAPALAAETDVRKVHILLEDEISAARQDIADVLRTMGAAAAATHQ